MSPAERRLWELLLAYSAFAGEVAQLANSPGEVVDRNLIAESLRRLDATRERVLGEPGPEPIEQEVDRLSAEDQARGGLR